MSLSNSGALSSPVVAAQYQHVRDFHRLMTRWTQDRDFPFASQWIFVLTGVENVKEKVAHEMIVQQVDRAHRLYPTMFQEMPGGRVVGRGEVSPRTGSCTNSTSTVPIDAAKLEEALVCHLSASYLCMWTMLRGGPQQQQRTPSPDPPAAVVVAAAQQTPTTSAAVSESVVQHPPVPSAPLVLQPTPAELQQRWRKGSTPSDAGADANVPHVKIPMHIARAVCRPGSGGVRQAPPLLVDTVQQVLANHEQQHTAALMMSAPQPRREFEKGFSVERMLSVRRKLANQNISIAQQEAIVASLRRSHAEEQIHPIRYNNNNVMPPPGGGAQPATNPRRPHTAGNAQQTGAAHQASDPLIFGSTSQRAVQVRGVVIPTATTIPSRPFTAKTSSVWSSRVDHGTTSSSSTVVAAGH